MVFNLYALKCVKRIKYRDRELDVFRGMGCYRKVIFLVVYHEWYCFNIYTY